ncbi:hypothetical protein LTS14_010115 [Recurvomyces mirabilis]|nr:hypothetical protein LTS14_010115 [Recurvomyces mirabilis]
MPSFVMEEAHLVPPHTVTFYHYKQVWYRGALRSMLREKYGNERKAYYDTYQPAQAPTDSRILACQKNSMALLRKDERRMMCQFWDAKGRCAILEWLQRRLAAANEPDPYLANGAHEDPVLVSIDFESTTWYECGIKEFGVITLDTRDLFQAGDHLPTLHSLNYIFSKHCSRRKFLFGDSQRLGKECIRDLIVDSLTIPETLPGMSGVRRVILVGHGIGNELRCMQDLGLPLHSQPMVVGAIDTLKLAADVLGRSFSLERLVMRLGISLNRNLAGAADQLHCAGNDANYTLRVLLALLEIQLQKMFEPKSPPAVAACVTLGAIARAGIPTMPSYLAREDEDESDFELGETFMEHD